jgi:ribonuclease Y
METARLMGMMAAEMGLNESIAKRVGLFHDIGKALDHTIEGNHAQIGADLLKRHGESPLVWQAVGAHHGEQPPESVYAHLATAADAITAARPGARLEATAIYLKRLEKLEAIANSFKGVQKTYAVQAGREIRVFVEPSQVDDAGALLLARNIGRRIVTEMQYPGQIRVVVVREVRCVEYAR